VLSAQIHAESLQNLAQARQEPVQESSCKAAAKQAGTALLPTDAAYQLCEVRSGVEGKSCSDFSVVLILFCL